MFPPTSPFHLGLLVRSLVSLIVGTAILQSTQAVHAQTPAFPGALGFGANVTGGRGGSVYHVTTLADSGAGSFRDAVSHSGRIIVFDVGGYIKLNTAVSCSGNLTIAGQTAPGGGIGFRGGEISFSSRSNIICRYIRIRPGSETASTTDDALAFANGRTMIFDHCSMEFGPWNNVDAVSSDWQTTPVTEVTFQNCLDADPTGQQFGAHTESPNSTMSWFNTVFANSHNRNPLSKINDIFVNNVLYNCGGGYTTHTSTSFSHDLVNNYFISGPGDGGSSDFPFFQLDNNQSLYYVGNLLDRDRDSTLNGTANSPYWYQGGSGTVLASPWSTLTPALTNMNATTAYRLCMSQAGALPRDQIDDLVISQVKTLGNGTTGTGAGTAGPGSGFYTSQTQTGLGNNGYGVLNGGIPAADSDGDGMPDYWERAVGLNFLSASDAMTIGADGYANIERYINWLGALHALTITNTAVDVDLWSYTSGFTNASPAYAVNNGSNGVVSITGGHIAHFVPDLNFSGLGSFRFSVVTSDSAYTNSIAVLVTPQSLSSGAGANLVWVGDGVSNAWSVGSGTNWFNGTNLVAFNTGDTVTFDDSGSNSPAINLSGILSATGINVIADNQDYTFSGAGILSGTATLFKVGAGNLFINTTNTFSGGVTIAEGMVQLGDGVNFSGSIGGNITNNDTLFFNNPGNVSSSASISGSGVLIKSGNGLLSLSGTQTYTNLTTINSGLLQFSGSVPAGDIVDNGSLILAPSGSTSINNFISGSGNVTLNAAGPTTLGGTNTYSGGTTNSTGTINIANSSAIGTGPFTYVAGAVRLVSGTVITNTFVIPSSTSDSMIDCVSGSATWAGDIVITGSSAQFRASGINGTLTLTGNGAFGNRNFIINRGTVRIASNAVFSATGSASSFDRNTTGNSASVTVQDNASVSFGAFSLGGGAASGGTMTLTIRDNATFTTTGNFDLHNSTAAAAISVLNLNGGMLSVPGIIKTKTGATQYSTNNFNGGTLKASGNNTAFLPALSGLTTVVKSGGVIIDDGGFAITIAAPLLHDTVLGATPDGGLTKIGAGILTLTTNEGYTGPTAIFSGRLAASGDTKILSNTSVIYVGTGAQLDVSGTAGGLTMVNKQTLSGNGAVIGDFRVNTGAIVSPGSNLIGTLTFSNSLILLGTSCTNIFKISHSPLTNDSAIVLGALANGGTLIVTNIGGTQLAAGDSFKLFNAASYSGAFSIVKLPSLPVGLAWNTNSLNTAGTISVVLATAPVIGSFQFFGNNLGFSGTGGVGNASYILLGATNLATPAGNWTPLLTNQFDSAGNNFTTNAGDAAQTFYRLQLQ